MRRHHAVNVVRNEDADVEAAAGGVTARVGMYLHAPWSRMSIRRTPWRQAALGHRQISDLNWRPAADEYRCIRLCGVANCRMPWRSDWRILCAAASGVVFVGPQTTADNYNATLLKHSFASGPCAADHRAGRAEAAGDGVNSILIRPQVDPILSPFYQSQASDWRTRGLQLWQVDIAPERRRARAGLSARRRDAKGAAFTIQSLGRGRVVFCSHDGGRQ